MMEPGRSRASDRARPAAGLGVALACSLLFVLSCSGGETGDHTAATDDIEPSVPDADIVIPRRTPELTAFPCVEQCHSGRQPNATPRPLRGFHSAKHIEHGDTTFWCNFCHNFDNLNTLRLLDGRTATFDEAYRLCGECHGDKRRDWALGIHGLQTGFWNGEKTRRSCTACHDPHSPRRPRFQALPAPHPRTGVQ